MSRLLVPYELEDGLLLVGDEAWRSDEIEEAVGDVHRLRPAVRGVHRSRHASRVNPTQVLLGRVPAGAEAAPVAFRALGEPEEGRMTSKVWSADDWTFAIFDPKCECGWFLADAEPVMSWHGVADVKGRCKRHGDVMAASWDICDVEPAA